MHMFTSNPHLMSEFSRQRHDDLLRQAQQWRLLQEAQRAQQLVPNPRRSNSLRATLATATALLRRLAPQPAPSNKQTAPC